MNEEIKKQDSKKSGFGPASLTLGIISIITAFFWYITIPTGILAIIFAAKGIKNTGSKLAKAGLVTGIVGLSIFWLVYTFMIIGILYEV